MKSILFVDFGNNKYNTRTIKHLESNGYFVTKYNVFKDTSVKNIDPNMYSCLMLGGGKKTISIYKLLDLPKNKDNNPLYETYKIINDFQNKPILAYGYGCIILGLYYRCGVHPLKEPNTNESQHIIVDHRYKINRSKMDPNVIKVKFNNKNTIVIPQSNATDTIVFQAKNKFEPSGFRFNTNHYGFLFRLIDSEYGNMVINNFLQL